MPTANTKGQTAFNKILKESNLHENVVISFLQAIGRVDVTPEDFDEAVNYANSLKVPNAAASPDTAAQPTQPTPPAPAKSADTGAPKKG